MTEFHYALSLGIGMTTGMAPAAVKGNGKVEAVEFKGFRDEAAELTLSADTIVFATGQKAEDMQQLLVSRLLTRERSLLMMQAQQMLKRSSQQATS